MKYETFPPETGEIEVVGGVNPGEKAGYLQDYCELAHEVGLSVPPTVVLAEELLAQTRDDLRSSGSPRVDEVAARTIGLFAARGLSPLTVVRSSAAADGRGTGVYDSVPTETRWGNIHSAVLDVLRSADTDGAKAFREQVGAADEMAVMLQPLVGQLGVREYTIGEFSPMLSGTAYTSTPRETGGVVNIVPGFGGGVTERGSIQLTPDTADDIRASRRFELDEFDEANILDIDDRVRLKDIIDKMSMSHIMSGQRTAFFDPRSFSYGDSARGSAFVPGYGFLDSISFPETETVYEREADGSTIIRSDVDYRDRRITTPFGHAMKGFYPDQFFEMMSEMESKAGVPLYLEWALTMKDEKTPQLWLVQIAPVLERDLPAHEQVEFAETMYYANGVIGEGVRKAPRVVILNNPGDVEHLHEYNADPANEGYVLVYTSRLTTSIVRGSKKLSWDDCSRASVILEWQDANHTLGTTPIDHIRGVTDVTGKIFGVIDWDKTMKARGDREEPNEYTEWRSPKDLGPGVPSYAHLEILEDEVTVVADQRSDVLVVGKTTDQR